MGTKKSFVKGLAAGAVLGAVAALYASVKEKDKKAVGMQKTASAIAKKVSAHAVRLGKLSRSAYDKIVDTAVAEYRGVKALSEDELDELRKELRDGWTDVQKMLSDKTKK